MTKPIELAKWLCPLAIRYRGNGIHDAHYAAVGNALLETLEVALGDEFTMRKRNAWFRAFDQIVTNMIEDASKNEDANSIKAAA